MAAQPRKPRKAPSTSTGTSTGRRRGAGEGTIYQRDDGRWTAQISLGYLSNGKRNRPQVYGDTYDEVREALLKLRSDAQAGYPVTPDKQTFREFAQWWVSEYADVRPTTRRNYLNIVNRHLSPALGRKPLRKLRPEDVHAYFRDKHGKLAASTLRSHYRLLRTIFIAALRLGKLSRNPAEYVSPPRPERVERVTLDVEQARAFLTVVRPHRLSPLFTAALALGLRRGEALGLRWADIDFERAELRVRNTLQLIEHKPTLTDTKTPKSRRTLSLPPVAVVALRAHRKRQLEERMRLGTAWRGSQEAGGMVFATMVGEPVVPEYVSRAFRNLLKKAGLPHMRLHDLRHSAASLMLAEGVDLKMVSETLGHSNISVTADLYIHISEPQRRSVARHMDDALPAPKDEDAGDDDGGNQGAQKQAQK